jgi:hypothetical protein
VALPVRVSRSRRASKSHNHDWPGLANVKWKSIAEVHYEAEKEDVLGERRESKKVRVG